MINFFKYLCNSNYLKISPTNNNMDKGEVPMLWFWCDVTHSVIREGWKYTYKKLQIITFELLLIGLIGSVSFVPLLSTYHWYSCVSAPCIDVFIKKMIFTRQSTASPYISVILSGWLWIGMSFDAQYSFTSSSPNPFSQSIPVICALIIVQLLFHCAAQ